MKLLNELSEILFPSRCFGCSTLGPNICSTCKKTWQLKLYRTQIRNIEVFSSLAYSPTAQRVILAAKEDGVLPADLLIASAIGNSLRYLLSVSEMGALVPVPSRRSSSRKRGRDFLGEITHRVGNSHSLDVHQLLEHRLRVRDQSNLNAQQRFENLAGALHVPQSKVTRINNGKNLILVDDLVTTGASLLEAKRALEAAGFNVIGAVTAFVSTPLR